MDTRKIPVFCYWNGCIKDGPDGPFYQGSTPRVIRVKSNTELPQLLDDLHRVTGFERGKFHIQIIGRYPSIVHQSMVKYMRLPIVDDSSLETMLEVPSYHPSINNVELYLEVKAVSDQSPLPNNGSSSANQATRKRSRQEVEVANVDADVDVNVRENTLRSTQEDNIKGWIEDDESVSKRLMFSSLWLDERELHVGMRFRDIEDLEKAVKLYSGRRQRPYNAYKYSTSSQFYCKQFCGWFLEAAKTKVGGLEITRYIGPHTCQPADAIQLQIEGLIRAQPSLSIAELIKLVKEEFGYTFSRTNMWDAKKKAITAILGNLDKSFGILPKFMAAFCSSNKMLLDWQYDVFSNPKDASFRSVFWAFQQSIEGFPHCRPLIMVDTVYLSGKYPMTMLIAAGLDAENRLFPLAFAIINQESLSADSWRWFFACIRKKVTQREGLCLITSLDPDIVAVVNEPECQWVRHRFCLRHLCFEFYDVFHNNLMTECVYKAGSSKDISSFDYYLKKIEEMNPDARKWLDKMPMHQWVLAHDDGGMRFGIMDTNLIFTTYSFLNKTRDLPITTCIMLIFDHLAELFTSRRGLPEESLNGIDMYAKHVTKMLEEYKVSSRTHDVLPLGQTGQKFQVTEVMQIEKNRFVVDLNDRVCTCGTWQLYKCPCSHVFAVCRRMEIDHLQYVNDCYSRERALKVYAAAFDPLPGVSDWPEDLEVPKLFPPGSRPTPVVQRSNSVQPSKLAVGRKQ